LCTEMIGEKVEVDIASATVIGLVALRTVVAMTTAAMVVTRTVADTETMIVIAVVGMILTEVAMTEIEVMFLDGALALLVGHQQEHPACK